MKAITEFEANMLEERVAEQEMFLLSVLNRLEYVEKVYNDLRWLLPLIRQGNEEAAEKLRSQLYYLRAKVRSLRLEINQTQIGQSIAKTKDNTTK